MLHWLIYCSIDSSNAALDEHAVLKESPPPANCIFTVKNYILGRNYNNNYNTNYNHHYDNNNNNNNNGRQNILQ